MSEERCPTCCERIAAAVDVCPECDEPLHALSTPPSTGGPSSLPGEAAGASWLSMHWRPLVTLGAVMALIWTGIALRYLAPGRFSPPQVETRTGDVAPACDEACWSGEACELGRCRWRSPSDVGHPSSPEVVTGPFPLPKDVSDVLPLDAERFAVARLVGAEIRDARTGEVLSLVSEAPQAQRLYRVGDVLYATSPQRVYVIDAETTRALKVIELGSSVGQLALGASGRRALVSMPSAHAIAVLTTEFHAEIDRLYFGDDPVGPVGVDDGGKRALTTTGQVPLAGLRDPSGGAVYAFDPSRYASTQDRVRASMLGNPVSVLMTPDGSTSYVVVRANDALVPLEWLPSGAVRQGERIPTCREPEQIELLRRERHAIVRCNEGRAVEIFDLRTKKLLRHLPLPARATDMAVTPDEARAIVTVPGEGSGLAIVDLTTYDVATVPLPAEPTRVRLTPNGATAVVWSDRTKNAWVLR
jgi:hypothetical protein